MSPTHATCHRMGRASLPCSPAVVTWPELVTRLWGISYFLICEAGSDLEDAQVLSRTKCLNVPTLYVPATHTATTLKRAYFCHPVKMQKIFKACILTKFPLKFWKGEEDNSPVTSTWIFYFPCQSCLLLLGDVIKPPAVHCLTYALIRVFPNWQGSQGKSRKIPSIDDN